MRDEQTLTFYAQEARAYADRYEGVSRNLGRFLALMPPAARILEIGCGAGRDTAAMIERGFDPVPTDGSPEMAAEASRRLGRPVRTLLFDEIDEVSEYDGVWAHACLLHISLRTLPDVLRRIHRAMRPGAWFFANYKAGQGEGRDKFGRYYSYPTESALVTAYTSAADWETVEVETQRGSGYDNQPTDWLAVLAKSGIQV